MAIQEVGSAGAPGVWRPKSSPPTAPPSPQLPTLTLSLPPQAPAAGGPQEVIYAQLDHPALAQRAARAVSLLSTEPTAKSSMYAVLARN